MHVLLVCRVNKKIGYGHLKRCISIGEYINKIGGKVSFCLLDSELSSKIDINYEHSMEHKSIDKEYINSNREDNKNYDFVILDLVYNDFFREYIFEDICNYFAPFSERLVAIDSIGSQSILTHRSTELLSKLIIPYAINETSTYPDGKIIYGPKYAILSAEYNQTLDRKYVDQAKNILISTGGSDNSSASKIILSAIENSRECLDIRLVIGPLFDNKYAEQLRCYESKMNITIVESPKSLYGHMLWADLAISASGGTKYELAATGTPSILFSWTEEDYKANKDFSKLGSCVDVGVGIDKNRLSGSFKYIITNRRIREEMGLAGRMITDGQGIGNIFEELSK